MGRRLFDYRAVPRQKRTYILAAMLFGSVLGYLAISSLVMRAGIVEGNSMAPALLDGQRFIINRIIYRLRDPEPGDVVAIRLPNEEDFSVKRIVALPGDVIQIKDGNVHVNGKRLPEPYLPAGITTEGRKLGDAGYAVADDCYFVLGDNRAVSVDSRVFGAVNRTCLVGRVGENSRRNTLP